MRSLARTEDDLMQPMVSSLAQISAAMTTIPPLPLSMMLARTEGKETWRTSSVAMSMISVSSSMPS